MKAIQDAVTAYLEQATGVRTVADRTRVPGVYPLLAVSVREDGTVLVDGGRQAEHTYRVSVTACSDRNRDNNTALLAALPVHLLRGIPMETEQGRRTLHPVDIRTEEEKLTFTLTVCVPVPPASPGTNPPGIMQTLRLDL